jgi:hypothetical protein
MENHVSEVYLIALLSQKYMWDKKNNIWIISEAPEQKKKTHKILLSNFYLNKVLILAEWWDNGLESDCVCPFLN